MNDRGLLAVRAGLVVLLSGTVAAGQSVFTTEDLDRAMKVVGRHVALLGAALESKDYAAAKERVARAREQLSPTTAFWMNAKIAEARKMVREATTKLDDLDAVLSSDPVDPARVAQAKSAVDQACQACHAVHREQDPATKGFRLKARTTP